MQAVQFLERRSVIQFFGACLTLAPFINIAVHVYLQSQKSLVTPTIVWKSLTIGTFSQNMQNLLGVSSLVIGIIMLLGNRRAWSFVLGLIGLQIVIQTTSLVKNVKESWVWGAVFVVNLAVFFFIADQLVFKEKRAEKDEPGEKNNKDSIKISVVSQPGPLESLVSTSATEASAPPREVPRTSDAALDTPILTTRKRILIHFSDLNMWGQMLHISNEGLRVKALETQALSFSSKPMVVFLRKNLPLRLQLAEALGPDFFFKFLPMTALEIQALNHWILEKADVKRGTSKDAFNSLSFTKKVS